MHSDCGERRKDVKNLSSTSSNQGWYGQKPKWVEVGFTNMTSILHPEIHPGPLNNLALHIPVNEEESFYLFSSENVRLNAIPSSNTNEIPPLQHSRQSITPSPQKVQKFKYAHLDIWTIRICQKVNKREQCNEVKSDDESSTEEEEEKKSIQKDKKRRTKGKGKSHVRSEDEMVIAWYSFSIAHDQIEPFLNQINVKRWDEMEALIRSAWEAGYVNVLGRSDDQNDDQTYSELQLQFEIVKDANARATSLPFTSSQRIKQETSTVTKEQAVDGEESKMKTISFQLRRISNRDSEVVHASHVACELVKAMGTLRTKVQSLERERNSSRKLIHDNRKHERYHEPSASLVNPGRIKRKKQDDGGFEGDEEGLI